MTLLAVFCVLTSVMSVMTSEVQEKDTCGVPLVECIQKKLGSDEVKDQWIECIQLETTAAVKTIEEVADYACNNKDDADHVAEVEKARECVRKFYEPSLYDGAKKECHQEMQAE